MTYTLYLVFRESNVERVPAMGCRRLNVYVECVQQVCFHLKERHRALGFHESHFCSNSASCVSFKSLQNL